MSDQKNIPQAAPNTGGDEVPILTPDDHLRHLLIEPNKGGWWVTLYASIRDLISPPKLPPLTLTSKPVKVQDIWGLYGYNKRSWMSSVVLHVAIVALAVSLAANKTVQQAVKNTVTLIAPLDIAPYVPKVAKQSGGWRGRRSIASSSQQGQTPQVFDAPVYVLPWSW